MIVEELNKYFEFNTDPRLKELWVSVNKDMIVHTRGEKPEHLLRINRPNEPKDILEYRLSTYFPITKDPILKALNSTYHLVKQSDYKIISSDKVKEYLAVKKFESSISVNKLKIEDLIFKSFLQIDIEDANGVLLVNAEHPYINDIPDNLPKTESIDIEIKYIQSKLIKYIDENVLIYEIGKTLVGEKSKQVEAKIYRAVNDTDIFTYYPIRVDDKGLVIYELQPYYNHNFGFVPFRVLGGFETSRTLEVEKYGKDKEKEYKFYDTFFTGYNSWANKSIIASSETDAVRVRYGFPVTERLGSECHTCFGKKYVMPTDCRTGKCGHRNNECSEIECGTCKGTGVVASLSPYREIIRKPQSNISTDNNSLDIPSLRYYSPPMESIGINKEYWYEMMDKAEQSISVYQTYNNQSGVAKEYDREQKRDFIAVIGDNLFDLLEFSIKCISAYLLEPTDEVKVIKPTRYEIRSKDGIIAEIDSVSKINKNLSKPLSIEYVEMEYDGKDKRILEILIENDIYYDYTLSELSSLNAMQKMDERAFQFHMNGFKWLNEIFETPANINLNNSEIMKLIDAKPIPTSTNTI